MNKIQIVPAILATTQDQYQESIDKIAVSSLPAVDWVHIDVVDNIFAHNKTIGIAEICDYSVLQKINSFKREAHLMVQNPVVLELLSNGFDRIILHVEANDINSTIDIIKNDGIEVGLALKLDTPFSAVLPYLQKVDVLLIMGINPGFQKQEFHSDAIDKISEIVRLRQKYKLDFKIGVDGGVNSENAPTIVRAGADYLVSGSFLMSGDIEDNLKKLRSVIYESN